MGTFSIMSLYLMQAADSIGSTVGKVSLALSIATAGSILGALFLGKALKALHHRVMIGIAAVCVLLFHFAISRSTSVTPIYIAAFFEGIGVSWGGLAMSQVVIAQWFEKARGTLMGLFLAVMSISLAAAYPTVARFVAAAGYRPVTAAVGVIAAAGMGVCALLMSGAPEQYGQAPHGADASAPAEGGGAAGASAFRGVLRSPAFWLICLIGCLAMVVSQGLGSQTMVVFRSFGLDEFDASYVAAIYSLAGLPWSFLFGLACDTLSPGKALTVFGGICAAVLFLAFAWHGFAGAAVFAVGFSAGGGVAAIYGANMALRLFGAGSAGDIMGFLSVWSGIGGSIGPALFGLMYDATGGYTLTLTIMGGLMAACIALNALLPKPSRREDRFVI
ncbi:MAG: MFS transporter [Clostridiales Family XIII bacterium]|nr:MFS transporter [Clostridiales Family XIII bacterium]